MKKYIIGGSLLLMIAISLFPSSSAFAANKFSIGDQVKLFNGDVWVKGVFSINAGPYQQNLGQESAAEGQFLDPSFYPCFHAASDGSFTSWLVLNPSGRLENMAIADGYMEKVADTQAQALTQYQAITGIPGCPASMRVDPSIITSLDPGTVSSISGCYPSIGNTISVANGQSCALAIPGINPPSTLGSPSTKFQIGDRVKQDTSAFPQLPGLTGIIKAGPQTYDLLGAGLTAAQIQSQYPYLNGATSVTRWEVLWDAGTNGGDNWVFEDTLIKASNTTNNANLPTGCTSTVGFSTTTGHRCDGTDLPAGCSVGDAFSSTTGQSCGTNTGTNGSTTDPNAANVILQANPTTVAVGGATMLSWTSNNLNAGGSCSIRNELGNVIGGNWLGGSSTGISSGALPAGVHTFTITCNSTVTDSVTVVAGSGSSASGGSGGTTGSTGATGGATGTTVSFTIGDTVRVVDEVNLNVRASATTSGSLNGQQAPGATGTIIDGPQTANGYTWYRVNYTTGVDGWSAGQYLQLVSSSSGTGFVDPLAGTTSYNPSSTLGTPILTAETSTQCGGKILIKWTSIPGATGYRLSGAGTGHQPGGVVLLPASTTSYVDTASVVPSVPTPGYNYGGSYSINATSNNGTVYGPSAPYVYASGSNQCSTSGTTGASPAFAVTPDGCRADLNGQHFANCHDYWVYTNVDYRNACSGNQLPATVSVLNGKTATAGYSSFPTFGMPTSCTIVNGFPQPLDIGTGTSTSVTAAEDFFSNLVASLYFDSNVHYTVDAIWAKKALTNQKASAVTIAPATNPQTINQCASTLFGNGVGKPTASTITFNSVGLSGDACTYDCGLINDGFGSTDMCVGPFANDPNCPKSEPVYSLSAGLISGHVTGGTSGATWLPNGGVTTTPNPANDLSPQYKAVAGMQCVDGYTTAWDGGNTGSGGMVWTNKDTGAVIKSSIICDLGPNGGARYINCRPR